MLRIDKYYDTRCDKCFMARSVDIDGGLGFWEGSVESFRRKLDHEGWKNIKGKTLCPNCAKAERRDQK